MLLTIVQFFHALMLKSQNRHNNHIVTINLKFEKIWTTMEERNQIIAIYWNSTNPDYTTKQRQTLIGLSKWGNATFGNITYKRKKAQIMLENLRR